MKCILGKKVGMTTLYDPEKGAQNVTLIACETNKVTLERTQTRDGYVAFQLEAKKTKKRVARKEIRVASTADIALEVGKEITVDIFSVGEKVDISGVTKGKGFQGVVKRHGFKGAPATHGHKHDLRKPGSIGATTPEHVFKGKRMAGRMGRENFTIKNLQIFLVDAEKGLLAVRGAVPGIPGGMVKIVAR